MKNITPNKYQEKIFDFIEHGNGNLIVEANAGCGKTSTMIMSLNLIPKNKKILFCAFNSDIVDDISKKIGKSENIDICTVHSLGLRMIKTKFKELKIEINHSKYKNYLYNNISNLTDFNINSLSQQMKSKYFQNILRLLDLFRYNLLENVEETKEIILKYHIFLIGDEVNVAFKLMKWGKENLNTIDYTDMIWIPNVLYLNVRNLKYDFIFGDECQDFSTAQREIIMKCKKINTRFIFCGDSNQSIYGFSSADINSFEKLKSIPNTILLSLPISYRCAKRIVEYAKVLVPSIEENGDGREGEIKIRCQLDDIKDGDMVLCRNNYPLVKIYSLFLKSKKKCYINGKDIGGNLKVLINSANTDNTFVTMFHNLYESLSELKSKLIENGVNKNDVVNTEEFGHLYDSIKAIEILSENATSIESLLLNIDDIFSDDRKEGIMLSTIHKAKGLEADRVFIACASLMPSKSAVLPWEVKQENNLRYVAFTRAKNFLGFIDEDIFKDYLDTSNVETMLDKLKNNTDSNVKYRRVLNLAEAKEIINKSKEIKFSGDSNIINGLEYKANNSTLTNLGKNKYKKYGYKNL